jgi:hypothetical protein
MMRSLAKQGARGKFMCMLEYLEIHTSEENSAKIGLPLLFGRRMELSSMMGNIETAIGCMGLDGEVKARIVEANGPGMVNNPFKIGTC